MTPFKTPYTRTTTATRRAANPNRFVHISKWFEEDKNGDPVECHKTFKLSAKEKYTKLLKRKWFRDKHPFRADLVKSPLAKWATTGNIAKAHEGEVP